MLNKQNGHGSTALHTALQLQHLDVFDRLLEAGADPTIKVLIVKELCLTLITLQPTLKSVHTERCISFSGNANTRISTVLIHHVALALLPTLILCVKSQK